MSNLMLKPTHKPIQDYYATLKAFTGQQVDHEGATSSAFQNLLHETAKFHDWVLIPQLASALDGDRTIRPDGTVRDRNYLPRGYWEAKDTHDDLDTEIKRKIAKGYDTANTIFEDTRSAVLYQDGREKLRISLDDKDALVRLLNEFYAHTRPDYERFEQAVQKFKEEVPKLAGGLSEKIQRAHADNPRFIAAFADFLGLCQNALNPNISSAAVDEMIIQHLLTERLIRKIFDQSEFRERNIIAREVEKVIAALLSKSFDREEYMRALDPFYRAIEDTGRTLKEFSEKQHFLNTVYERFFQGYCVKLADTHGIVYTPQAIVDFMCASVAEALEKEFGKTLGSEGVNFLDPCTGTGNFIVNLIKRISRKDLPRVYRSQLFANEVMLLPYYIASLNIERAYFERTGEYEPFDGLCFVDTLELAEARQSTFEFFTEKNTERVQRQKDAKITVIIGNPPYNVGQRSENDNNKNRKYPEIDRRIRETYAKDSKATNKNALSDAYVKFFRWAADRLLPRDGIVCFVSNNSFVDQIAFDGMRKRLLEDFSRVYHIDLNGNVRQNPKLSGTTHNVFGIQVGVGITIAVRKQKHRAPKLFYHRVPENWRKEEKLDFLRESVSIHGVKLKQAEPDEDNHWILLPAKAEFQSFLSIGSRVTKSAESDKNCIFKTYSRGVATSRDDIVYGFKKKTLETLVSDFSEAFNSEIDRYKRRGSPLGIDDFVNYDKLKWSRDLKLDLSRGHYTEFDPSKIRLALYRPWLKKYLYFDRTLNEEVYSQHRIFPKPDSQNVLIAATDIGSEKPFMALISNLLCDLHVVSPGCQAQCFPFYVYDEDGGSRRENITDWALKLFRAHYGDKKITKRDIFHYVYAILHHPGYREKFADNLKRELPRIPFAHPGDFKPFVAAGERLAKLHLDYESVKPFNLKWVESPDKPLCYRVEKMRLTSDKKALIVNDTLTLENIPPEAFQYRLGNRSALEWVIDQHQVGEDRRSGIISDPNRADDPEYIINLVGRVAAVSVETVKIVAALPQKYGGPPRPAALKTIGR
jgi:predicted helicase